MHACTVVFLDDTDSQQLKTISLNRDYIICCWYSVFDSMSLHFLSSIVLKLDEDVFSNGMGKLGHIFVHTNSTITTANKLVCVCALV